jgi:hypothetical protein
LARKKVPDSAQQQSPVETLQSGESNESVNHKKDSQGAGKVPAVSVIPSVDSIDDEALAMPKLRRQASSNSLASAPNDFDVGDSRGVPPNDRTPTNISGKPKTPSLISHDGEILADPDSHVEDDFGPWRMNSGSGPAGSAAKARETGQKRRSTQPEDAIHRAGNEKAPERRADQEIEDEDYGAFNHNHGDDNDLRNKDTHIHNIDGEQAEEHDFREDIFTLHRPKSSSGRTPDIAPSASTSSNATKLQASEDNTKPSPIAPSIKVPPALPARRRKPIPDSHPQAIPFISASNPASTTTTTTNPRPNAIEPESDDTDLADVHLGLVPDSTNPAAMAAGLAGKTRTEEAGGEALKIPPQAVREVEREIGEGRGKGGEEGALIDL